VLVGGVVLLVRHASASGPIEPADVPSRQAKLLDQARTAHLTGGHAEAVAFASEAIRLAPTSELAARALVVRGTAELDNGDRADGFEDLQDAIRRLPPGDVIRAEAERALRRARP
jgi:hypothetical protein